MDFEKFLRKASGDPNFERSKSLKQALDRLEQAIADIDKKTEGDIYLCLPIARLILVVGRFCNKAVN